MKQAKQVTALNFVLIQTVAMLTMCQTSQRFFCIPFFTVMYILQVFRGKFELVMFHNVSIQCGDNFVVIFVLRYEQSMHSGALLMVVVSEPLHLLRCSIPCQPLYVQQWCMMILSILLPWTTLMLELAQYRGMQVWKALSKTLKQKMKEMSFMFNFNIVICNMI